MESKKNILAGNNKFNFYLFILVYFFLTNLLFAKDNTEGAFTDLKILDKISSKNTLVKLKNGELTTFKDLTIKSLKCKNSEFDDNPEITAYIQVKDLTDETLGHRKHNLVLWKQVDGYVHLDVVILLQLK